jgi:hypothetical protein
MWSRNVSMTSPPRTVDVGQIFAILSLTQDPVTMMSAAAGRDPSLAAWVPMFLEL